MTLCAGLPTASARDLPDPRPPELPSAQSGFGETRGASSGGGAGDFLEALGGGLRAGLVTSLAYDTNAGQSPGTAAAPERGSLMAGIGPSFAWSREAGGWTAMVRCDAGYDRYFEENDYSGGRYIIGAALGYDGGRWRVDSSVRHGYADGMNRYYAASVSQYTHGIGMSGSLVISPKTSLGAEWASSWSEPDGGFGGTESHSLGATAMWRHSRLLSIGPGVRWTRSTGETQGDRDTLGPLLAVTYQLSRKVSLNGRVGLDFVDYEGGGDDTFLAAGLAANYRISSLWALDFSLLRDAAADGAGTGAFRETTALRMGVTRKIRRVDAELGLGYERSSYVATGGGAPRPDADYLTYDLVVRFPVWSDRLTGAAFIRHQDSASDDISRDWSATQTGISLTYRF